MTPEDWNDIVFMYWGFCGAGIIWCYTILNFYGGGL